MSWHSRRFFRSFHEMCALSLRQRHYFCSAARSRKREASPRLVQSTARIEHISSRPPEALTLSKYRSKRQVTIRIKVFRLLPQIRIKVYKTAEGCCCLLVDARRPVGCNRPRLSH